MTEAEREPNWKHMSPVGADVHADERRSFLSGGSEPAAHGGVDVLVDATAQGRRST